MIVFEGKTYGVAQRKLSSRIRNRSNCSFPELQDSKYDLLTFVKSGVFSCMKTLKINQLIGFTGQ